MFSLKRLSILIIAAVIIVSTVCAQVGARREMTPEELYLQETIELMIIRETARSTTREQKLISLEYIGELIDRGNRNDEIRQTLEFLATEGTRTQIRENNRLINNFPDVRRRAAIQLGRFGTEEATNALIDVIQLENEPMVIQEAIKSLGDIGINNNNETIRTIVFVVDRLTHVNPDNLVALATIDTFERIAESDGSLSHDAVQLLVRIATEGTLVFPVRERARQLLADLRSFQR